MLWGAGTYFYIKHSYKRFILIHFRLYVSYNIIVHGTPWHCCKHKQKEMHSIKNIQLLFSKKMQEFFWPPLIIISLAVIWQLSRVPVLLCSQWTSFTRCNSTNCSVLASSKFMEQFFIKGFILVFRSCGEEDVTTDEFMDHLAVTAQTTEGYWHILVKLYGHLE